MRTLQNQLDQYNIETNEGNANSLPLKCEVDQLYMTLIRTKKPDGNWERLDVCQESDTKFQLPSCRIPIEAIDQYMLMR